MPNKYSSGDGIDARRDVVPVGDELTAQDVANIRDLVFNLIDAPGQPIASAAFDGPSFGAVGGMFGAVAGLAQAVTADTAVEQVKGAVDAAGGAMSVTAVVAEHAGGATSAVATWLGAAGQVVGILGMAANIWIDAGRAIDLGIQRSAKDGGDMGFSLGFVAGATGADLAWVRENFAAYGEPQNRSQLVFWQNFNDQLGNGFREGSKLTPEQRAEFIADIVQSASEQGAYRTWDGTLEDYKDMVEDFGAVFKSLGASWTQSDTDESQVSVEEGFDVEAEATQSTSGLDDGADSTYDMRQDVQDVDTVTPKSASTSTLTSKDEQSGAQEALNMEADANQAAAALQHTDGVYDMRQDIDARGDGEGARQDGTMSYLDDGAEEMSYLDDRSEEMSYLDDRSEEMSYLDDEAQVEPNAVQQESQDQVTDDSQDDSGDAAVVVDRP